MRQIIDIEAREKAFKKVMDWMARAIALKGEGSFYSLHELRGAVSEEYDELMEAFHRRDTDNISREMKDLAVVLIFGLACLREVALP